MRYQANEKHEFPNGAIGWRPGGPFDVIGPYAKVQNCPVIVDGKEIMRRITYATSPADSAFLIPARFIYRGAHIGGFMCIGDAGGPEFRPVLGYIDRLKKLIKEGEDIKKYGRVLA